MIKLDAQLAEVIRAQTSTLVENITPFLSSLEQAGDEFAGRRELSEMHKKQMQSTVSCLPAFMPWRCRNQLTSMSVLHSCSNCTKPGTSGLEALLRFA
jgi:hypothetical protein